MLPIVLRFLGILFLLPSLFFQTFLNWFPGLPDSSNFVFLGIGALLFIAGAVVSAFGRKKTNDSDSELI